MYIRTCNKGHKVDSDTSQMRVRNNNISYICWECHKASMKTIYDKRPRINMRTSDEERFWSKVNKNGPMSKLGTICWIWLGNTDSHGHGQFYIDGIYIGAHRYSFSLIEDLKDDLDTHHKCEIKLCVRQDHLEQFTRIEHFKLHEKLRNLDGTYCAKG